MGNPATLVQRLKPRLPGYFCFGTAESRALIRIFPPCNDTSMGRNIGSFDCAENFRGAKVPLAQDDRLEAFEVI
jgi:hypothetical protein